MSTEDKEKLRKQVKRCENYFYIYLLTKDKNLIDKYFKLSKKIKKNLRKGDLHV